MEYDKARYSHFKLSATIWDAILKMVALWDMDFGKLLVCYLACLEVPESVDKSFVTFFLLEI